MRLGGVRRAFRSLGTLNTHQQRSSPQRIEGSSDEVSIEDIRLKLKLAEPDEQLGWDGISRIQDRILSSLDHLDLGEPLTDEDLHRMIDESAAEKLSDLPSSDGATVPERSERAQEATRWTSGRIRMLVAGLACILCISAIAPFASNSMPGDFLFPVKLQVESIRLSLSDGLERAEVQIAIGRDRLRSIEHRTTTMFGVMGALGDLEAAELDALDLVTKAAPSPNRRRVASDLAGLAKAHLRQLSAMGVRNPLLEKSMQAATWVLAQASLLLSEPISLTRSDPDPAAAMTPGEPVQPRTTRAVASGPRAHERSAGSQADAVEATPPQNPDGGEEDCTVTSGAICITVPRPDSVLPL